MPLLSLMDPTSEQNGPRKKVSISSAVGIDCLVVIKNLLMSQFS